MRYVAQTNPLGEKPAPPAWIVRWLEDYLRSQGYVAVEGAAPYLLAFEWGAVDDQVSHLGRPLQSVESAGRWVIAPRETMTRRYYEKLYASAPVCVVSVYKQTFTGEPPTGEDLKWQMKFWLLLFQVPASGRVFAGPMTVLDYSFPASDAAKSKAPSTPDGK